MRSPTAPIRRGTRVCHEDQGYITPPHERGIRKEEILAMKRMVPI
jgi:hypothetical protein